MSKPDLSKLSGWAGVMLTVIVSASAVTVQWGVITTKLEQVEKRLDAFLSEAKTIREEYVVIGHRVAFIEGQLGKHGVAQ